MWCLRQSNRCITNSIRPPRHVVPNTPSTRGEPRPAWARPRPSIGFGRPLPAGPPLSEATPSQAAPACLAQYKLRPLLRTVLGPHITCTIPVYGPHLHPSPFASPPGRLRLRCGAGEGGNDVRPRDCSPTHPLIIPRQWCLAGLVAPGSRPGVDGAWGPWTR